MKSNVVYLCLISCLIIMVSGQAVHATWIPDGVEVAHYPTPDPDLSEIVSDGAGGSIIVWQDNRNGDMDIYAQRIDSNGAVLWTIDGVPICTATGEQSIPRITSDGAGGAVVTWQDLRSGIDD
ncbi:MAG: hypothetical protein KAV42_11885, partial [Candidatus Krumholzibacteria bacterium]|nr:hypothetical protein [Candidatus Krumholzibacteria bacterium]